MLVFFTFLIRFWRHGSLASFKLFSYCFDFKLIERAIETSEASEELLLHLRNASKKMHTSFGVSFS